MSAARPAPLWGSPNTSPVAVHDIQNHLQYKALALGIGNIAKGGQALEQRGARQLTRRTTRILNTPMLQQQAVQPIGFRADTLLARLREIVLQAAAVHRCTVAKQMNQHQGALAFA